MPSLPGLTALAAFLVVLVAYGDTPWRTLGQPYRVNRWPERLVLFSVELNLVLLWMLAKLVLQRDVPVASAAWAPIVTWLGAAVALAGALLAVWSKFTLGRWFSATFAIKPGHELVTTGPYAIVRHPMYTALLLLGVGCALAFDSALTLALAALFVLPLGMHTWVEEQVLEGEFGDAWRDYRRRVPRLLPFWPKRA